MYKKNDVENNCYYMYLYDFTGKFETRNFHAHKGILGAHGAAHISMDSTHIGFGYKPIVQTLADGKQVPGIGACDFGWDLTKKNLGFHASGSFWDGFADMFKNLFEDDICNALIDKVRDELMVKIPADLNKMIADTDGAAEIMPKWFLDFQASEAGHITENAIEIGARGILYDGDIAETIPTFPAAMPYKDDNLPSSIQGFVSQQTIQSALDSFLQVHPVAGWFNATEVPAGAKFSLTTGFLEKAFKGISDYYGPDALVDVQFDLKSLHDFTVAANSPDLTLLGDIDLKFWVETVNGTELAVDLSVKDFTYAGQVVILEDNALQMNITKLKVKNILVNSCSFGKIGTFKLQMGLNVALAVAAPTIEQKFDTLSLPTSLGKFVNLSDLVIAYYDGFIGLGATPAFVPFPLPPAPTDAGEASTVCVENRAGFVLKFHLEDTYTGEKSSDSEHYPVLKQHCMDIKTAFPNIREGQVVKTVIKASAGKTEDAQHTTTYKADAGTFTTFTCRGTTLHYHCNDEYLDTTPSMSEDVDFFARAAAAFFQ